MHRTVLATLTLAALASAQTFVTTAQYDNARTGSNLREAVLSPRNVNVSQFGRLFTLTVDGDVYAQPLFVPALDIPGKGRHDVVFIATEHNSVYAFEAAAQPSELLWKVSFLGPGVETASDREARCPFISPEIGITGTPVIDAVARTMYILARTKERGRFYQRLHALDIVTGAERPGSPVVIRATVKGAGLLGLLRSDVSFHALLENPRAALLLANDRVYLAWGSSCDVGPYYGWVMAYDAHTLQQLAAFNTAPDAGESGIWQSDAGLAADTDGNVYAVTGNGKFNASSGGRDYGDSVLKLGLDPKGLVVRDYFTPFNQARLNSEDADLGSSGPVLLPDQPGAHPHELVVAGKAGMAYLIDRDRMGRFRADSDSHAVQTLNGIGDGAFGAPAYWNGHLYYFGSNDVLKDFAISNGRISAQPIHQAKFRFKDPGAIPVVSANGARDGVVWVVISKGWRDRDTVGALQAYDASDVANMIYTSEANASRDAIRRVLRFTMPTVAGGRVYVGARGEVNVYGLLHPAMKKR